MTKLKFFVASFICLCVYATLTTFSVTSTLFEKLVTVLVTVKIVKVQILLYEVDFVRL